MVKIVYEKGEVVKAPEYFIAHGCNAQGVMNSGVAKTIRKTFPKAYEDYIQWYEQAYWKGFGKSPLGDVIITKTENKAIFNCITQMYYGRNGKQYVDYEAVEKCMIEINNSVGYFQNDVSLMDKDMILNGIAMPMIGAGLGGGDWNIISDIIESTLTNVVPTVYQL